MTEKENNHREKRKRLEIPALPSLDEASPHTQPN